MLKRIVDSTIPTGCLLGFAGVVFGFQQLPSSVTLIFSSLYSFLWSSILFLSCLFVLVGVWLRNRFPLVSYSLEYIGLISAGILVLVYTGAVYLRFGSESSIAIGISLSISLYYLARWAELQQNLRRAKKKDQSSRS